MTRIANALDPRAPDEPKAHEPPAAKKDFARHLKATKRTDDKPQAQPDGQPAPPSLPQVLVALMTKAGNAEACEVTSIPALKAGPKIQIDPQALDATPELAKTLATFVAKPAVEQAPLTPLEQAVHDLLAELGTPDEHDVPHPVDHAIAPILMAQTPALETPEPVIAAKPAAPVAETSQPAELVSQHHAHIVLDEPGLRIVMTVAVRGNDVNVNLRSTDDATAAALARNAASLDDALRGHKLEMHGFTAEHERESHRDRPNRDRDPETAEPFVLEELP